MPKLKFTYFVLIEDKTQITENTLKNVYTKLFVMFAYLQIFLMYFQYFVFCLQLKRNSLTVTLILAIYINFMSW